MMILTVQTEGKNLKQIELSSVNRFTKYPGIFYLLFL